MTPLVPAIVAACAVVAGVVGVRGLVTVNMPFASWAARGPFIERIARGRMLATALRRAGLGLSADRFVCLVAAGAACSGLLVWRVLGTATGAVVTTVGTIGLAAGYVGSADRRYLERIGSAMPAVAQQLGGALAAGLSLRQAVIRAAVDAPEPARAELALVARELELGARVDHVLEAMTQRLPEAGLRIMVTAIVVQRQVGGNLAQALGELSGRLDERRALEREARSATAQARMSAWLVAGLPLAGGVLVEIAAPGTLARTIGQGPGLAVLLVATVLEIGGIWTIHRILRGQEAILS